MHVEEQGNRAVDVRSCGALEFVSVEDAVDAVADLSCKSAGKNYQSWMRG
jgi:hypothetical protein